MCSLTESGLQTLLILLAEVYIFTSTTIMIEVKPQHERLVDTEIFIVNTITTEKYII